MYCHEMWQFNENTGYQFLQGLQALCQLCHGVKHITFIHDEHLQAKLLEHFMVVNHVTREEAEEYLLAVRQEQRKLNQKHWIINYGKYNWQVPSAATIQQRRNYANFNHPQYRQPTISLNLL